MLGPQPQWPPLRPLPRQQAALLAQRARVVLDGTVGGQLEGGQKVQPGPRDPGMWEVVKFSHKNQATCIESWEKSTKLVKNSTVPSFLGVAVSHTWG